MRNLTHLTFESYDVALAFVQAHNLTNVTIREIHPEPSHPVLGTTTDPKRSAAPGSETATGHRDR